MIPNYHFPLQADLVSGISLMKEEFELYEK